MTNQVTKLKQFVTVINVKRLDETKIFQIDPFEGSICSLFFPFLSFCVKIKFGLFQTRPKPIKTKIRNLTFMVIYRFNRTTKIEHYEWIFHKPREDSSYTWGFTIDYKKIRFTLWVFSKFVSSFTISLFKPLSGVNHPCSDLERSSSFIVVFRLLSSV